MHPGMFIGLESEERQRKVELLDWNLQPHDSLQNDHRPSSKVQISTMHPGEFTAHVKMDERKRKAESLAWNPSSQARAGLDKNQHHVSAYRPPQKQPRFASIKKEPGEATLNTVLQMPKTASLSAKQKSANAVPPTWQDYLQSLEMYERTNGHLNVPHDFIDPRTNIHLGAWVTLLRTEYHAKYQNPDYRSQVLSRKRVAVLAAMGMEWDPLGLLKPNPWWVDFVRMRRLSPKMFASWAEKNIQQLEATKASVIPDLDDSSYNPFEYGFRINLLKLTLKTRHQERFKWS